MFRNLSKTLVAIALAFPAVTSFAQVAQWDTYPDTWVAMDELKREVASSDNCQIPPRENRTVGMFYYLWHGPHGKNGNPIKDVTVLLNENADAPQWGAEKEYHWWGKPWLGYYVNTDDFIYNKHLQMLCDAGVDFLFLDLTNAVTYDKAIFSLMKAITVRSSRGLSSPKICFTLNSKASQTFQYLYTNFFTKPAYDKYWYLHDGKPLILVDKSQLTDVAPDILDKFTMKHSWAWMQGAQADQWAWLEFYPQKPGWTMKDGKKVVEQISVSTGQHAHSKIGKSYHKGKQPAFDKKGLCAETPLGLYFDEQWQEALKVDPPLVMVTQFNEGIAMRFIATNAVEATYSRPGATPAIGESYFIDTYNAEFNRDIEPSTHPSIRDNYYMQLCDRVRRYKGMRPIPTPSATKTISINNDMTQWDGVLPEFRDDRGDIWHRNTKGYQNMDPIVNTTGRTDLDLAKVAQDDTNLYFYLRSYNLMPEMATNDTWVMMLLNVDCNYSTGWNGYDYATMKQGDRYMLMRNKGGEWKWEEVAPLDVVKVGNQIHFAVAKSNVGIVGCKDFDFKWCDNVPDNPDILDFIDKGDVAPNGRFNYRFKGSATQSGVESLPVAEMSVTAVRVGKDAVRIVWNDTDLREVAVYNPQGQLVKKYAVNTADRTDIFPVPEGLAILRLTTPASQKCIKLL